MRRLLAPPQILWLFQACERHCPDFYRLCGLAAAVDVLYTPEWTDPTTPAAQLFSRPPIYSELCLFLFESGRSEHPIDVLQRNGYFLRGSRTVLDPGSEFCLPSYLAITECLMWAYIDRKIPHSEMLKVLGRSDGLGSQDAEALLCRWINAIVSKYAQLAPLSVIGQQFFGLPYFRIVLFHFTMEDELLNPKDTTQNNATAIFDASRKLDIPLPFDETQVIQPPLAILCFLCYAIVLLAKLPTVKKRAPVSDAVVARRISGLRELRTEVSQLQHRCKLLNSEVAIIAQSVNDPRPQSMLLRDRPRTGPPLPSSVSLDGRRRAHVRWAPEVLDLAKRLQVMKQTHPVWPSD
jgi:hypothetical protein